jgi:hypothetical protein
MHMAAGANKVGLCHTPTRGVAANGRRDVVEIADAEEQEATGKP